MTLLMRNCFIALLHAGLVLALTAILLSASASRAEAHGAGDDPGAEAVETGDACCHAQAGAHCSPLGAPPGALSFAGRQKTGVGGGEPPASRPLAAPAPGVPPPIRSAA